MGNTWCTCVTAKGALAMRPGLERVRERCSETHLSASLFISPGRPEWRLSLENYKKNAAELRLSQLREHLCGLSSSPHGELMEPLLSESTVNHTFHPCLPNSAAAAVLTFTSPFLGLAPITGEEQVKSRRLDCSLWVRLPQSEGRRGGRRRAPPVSPMPSRLPV